MIKKNKIIFIVCIALILVFVLTISCITYKYVYENKFTTFGHDFYGHISNGEYAVDGNIVYSYCRVCGQKIGQELDALSGSKWVLSR